MTTCSCDPRDPFGSDQAVRRASSFRLTAATVVALLALGGCAASVPSQEQVLRDAEANQASADAGWEWSQLGAPHDFVVAAVTVDQYEKDLAKAIVHYRVRRNVGIVGMKHGYGGADCTSSLALTYRFSSGFWKLESANGPGGFDGAPRDCG
jgi:hypothetical protein